MNKYDYTNSLEDVINNPGVWIELEIDENTGIYENNGAKYFVTINKNIICANTGLNISDDILEVMIDNIKSNLGKYKWMYIYKLETNLYN